MCLRKTSCSHLDKLTTPFARYYKGNYYVVIINGSPRLICSFFNRANKQQSLVITEYSCIMHYFTEQSAKKSICLFWKVVCSFYSFSCFVLFFINHWIKTFFYNKFYLFLWQNINFTDRFYAPPVVIVTAKRINNDSRLSGCNAITSWVEVKLQCKLADSTSRSFIYIEC